MKGPKGSVGLQTNIRQHQWRINQSEDLFNDIHMSEVKDGLSLMIHGPFEVPSEDSVKIQTITNQTVDLYVTPKVTQIEKSLKKYLPEE